MPAVRSIDPRAREAILRELGTFAVRLAAELDVEAVYLFGSLARGDQHEGSDIDLLVVARYPGRALELVGEIIRRTELPVEPLVVRPETLARRLQDGHPLFVRALRDGVRLYPASHSSVSAGPPEPGRLDGLPPEGAA
jgi:predicted nucleotidyltransferase